MRPRKAAEPATAQAVNGLQDFEQLPGRLRSFLTRNPPAINSEDDGYAVYDGLRQIGFIKPQSGAFEAYRLVDDEPTYLAKTTTRTDAMRLIREATR